MQTGSLVETVCDCSDLEREWGFVYPKRGDILTVNGVSPHGNAKLRAKGIVLLTFDEMPNTPAMCDKQFNGQANFLELQKPMKIDIEELTPCYEN